MPGFKRAFLWASAGRYAVTLISLSTSIIMARLLTPGEYGLSVLGGAVFLIADAIRGLAGGSYLVQTKELNSNKIRTSWTISLLVTLLMALAVAGVARPIAAYYGNPMLERYLLVVVISYLIGPFSLPIMALMSREMAFERLAIISIVSIVANGSSGIILAFLGFSIMSYAWANVAAAVSGVLCCFYFYRDFSLFRPQLNEWRNVLGFGLFDSATIVLNKLTENLFYLVLGRILNVEAVGLCQRAFSLAGFPERVILSGLGAVALPAFSEQVRRGHDLKSSYLKAIEYITAIQWPALMLLVVLARPLVQILLGQQWLEVAPLLQIFAAALFFNYPVGLEYPTLVAAGAIRYVPALILAQAVVFTSLWWLGTALYGLYGGAMSMLIIVPIDVLLSLSVVRCWVPFTIRELAGAMRKSVVILGLSAVGPAITAIGVGWGADMPKQIALVAVILCAIGWFYGLRLSRHPLAQDVLGARDTLVRGLAANRLIAASVRLFRSTAGKAGRGG